jgi:hypothetical protein
MTRPGYEMHGELGSMKVVGALQTDEVFTGNLSGSINVSAMWRDIYQGKAAATLRTNCLMHPGVFNGFRDLDKQTLDTMPEQRINVPIIGIARKDGTVTIVDGNHRLVKRRDRGDQFFSAYFFDESALEDYKVEIYMAKPGEDWKLQTNDELLAQTIGTYAVRDERGNVVGMRDERKKA